ncbi:hypothetical protein FKM82_010004 [Ascaphus truei]
MHLHVSSSSQSAWGYGEVKAFSCTSRIMHMDMVGEADKVLLGAVGEQLVRKEENWRLWEGCCSVSPRDRTFNRDLKTWRLMNNELKKP